MSAGPEACLRMARGGGFAVTAAGILVLVGWAFGIGSLTSLSPTWVTMKANTALCLIALGLALVVATKNDSRARGSIRTCLAAAAALVGLASLLEDVLGLDFGIDQILFPEKPGAPHTLCLGRMALPTSLFFVGLGSALVLLGRGAKRSAFARWLCVAASIGSLFEILSYAYRVEPTWGPGSGTRMALHTALCFLVLSLATPLARPEEGFWKALRSASSSGSVARRLLPASLLVPAVIAGFTISGDRIGIYDPAVGVLFVAATYMILLFLITISTIRTLDRSEALRARAELALRQSEERFSKAFALSRVGQSISTRSEGRIIDVNEAYCDIVGYRREELVGRIVAELRLYEDPQARELLLEDLARDGVIKEARLRVRSRAGRIRTVQISMTPIRLGEEDCLISSVVDITSRLRAEQALRKSERRFRALFRSSPLPMLLAELDGSILSVNSAFTRVYGFSRRELRTVDALKAAAVRGDESRRLFDQAWELAMKDKATRQSPDASSPRGFRLAPIELDIACADGSARRVELSCAFLEDIALAVFNDISERRKAEEARSEMEGRYRAYVEQATESLLVHDLQGRFLEVNRRACEALGYSREELLSMGVFDVEVGIERETALASWRELQPGRFLTLLGRQRRKDGPTFPVEVRLGRLEWKDQRLVLDLVRDITERVEAERAIRASEERYRSLFENMIEGFAFCRMEYEDGEPIDFTYIAVNPAFYALTGVRDVVGRRASEAVEGIRGTDPAFFDAYGRIARTREPDRFELEVKALGLWLSISVYFPSPGYFVAVFDVITERKKAEAALLALNAELEERVSRRTSQLEAANAELEAFSYSVSHDLRSPLRGIDGWSAAIEEEFGSAMDGRARAYLSRVRSEATRMGQLIDSLLQLARVSRSELRLEDMDLSELSESVARRIKGSYPGRAIDFAIEPGMRGRGDRSFIEIALVNLFDNACKFTSKRERAIVEFGRSSDGSFFVRDNGAGFDIAYASRLFAPFQRMHKAAEYPGTGIGLATVQRIVAKHGGRIWAEAKLGEGATFHFSLGERG